MNDQQLDRNLRSIGKECFVTFFGELSDFELSNEAVARYIAEDWGRDYDAALALRVNPARRVIKAGRAADALIICSNSARLPQRIRGLAATLADQIRKQHLSWSERG